MRVDFSLLLLFYCLELRNVESNNFSFVLYVNFILIFWRSILRKLKLHKICFHELWEEMHMESFAFVCPAIVLLFFILSTQVFFFQIV